MALRGRSSSHSFLMCADSSATAGGGGGGGGTPSPGPNNLVLRIDTSGGFVSPAFTMGQIPGFSLFGDGRVITTGAQIEIYPQPALPPVLVAWPGGRAGVAVPPGPLGWTRPASLMKLSSVFERSSASTFSRL